MFRPASDAVTAGHGSRCFLGKVCARTCWKGPFPGTRERRSAGGGLRRERMGANRTRLACGRSQNASGRKCRLWRCRLEGIVSHKAFGSRARPLLLMKGTGYVLFGVAEGLDYEGKGCPFMIGRPPNPRSFPRMKKPRSWRVRDRSGGSVSSCAGGCFCRSPTRGRWPCAAMRFVPGPPRWLGVRRL